jgi:HlyD family type I secretion membrane fusion protein
MKMLALESKPLRLSKSTTSSALSFESATAEVLAQHHPLLERGTLFVLASMVVFFFVFISVKKIDRVITATGRIVPVKGILTVQPLDKAIISHIYVAAGDEVKKGQILATCDPTFVHADLIGLQQKVESLQAQKQRMEAEESNKTFSPKPAEPYAVLQASIQRQREMEYNSGLNDFNQRIKGVEADITGLKDNIANYEARLKIADEQEKMYTTLEQEQVTSHLQSMNARDQTVEIERQLAAAKNSLASELHSLESLKEQRRVFVEKRRDDNLSSLVEVENSLDEARDELAKAQKLSDLVNLVSPEDAVVLRIPDLSQGGIASGGEPLFSLIPLNAPVEVDAAIDARDSGFVKVGDPVRIKLDAYRFMEHGVVEGVIKTISQDSFTESSGQDALTRSTYNRADDGARSPYFDTRIKLTALKLHDVPANTRLTPGMTLQADIVVGQRTILWYILGGVLHSGSEAMREP